MFVMNFDFWLHNLLLAFDLSSLTIKLRVNIIQDILLCDHSDGLVWLIMLYDT